MTLPSRQCGNGGRSQSRPFPARAVKVMESAAQRCEPAANAARLRMEDEVRASAKCVTAGETAQVLGECRQASVLRKQRGRTWAEHVQVGSFASPASVLGSTPRRVLQAHVKASRQTQGDLMCASLQQFMGE